MKIYEALNINKSPVVLSIIGGGGKTSTMFHLAQELKTMGKKVLVTTTTHISVEQGQQLDQLIIEPDYTEALKKVKKGFHNELIIGLTTMMVRNKKLKGIPPQWVEGLQEEKIVDVILVEADGARGRPFKVPGDNEPVLPSYNDGIISVIGIDTLDKPITDEYVHRPDVMLTLLEKGKHQREEILDIENIIKIFKHEKGPLKNIQEDVGIFILINKVGDEETDTAFLLANNLVKEVGRPGLKVLIGQVQNTQNPISHVIEDISS